MNPEASPAKQPSPLLIAFISVTTLFFAWGFITSMNDPLIPAVRAVFNLNYTESLLTQFAFFIAYAVISIPGSTLVGRISYHRAIVVALFAMIVGCMCIPLATLVESYSVVLIALFIIASGITVLQVAANPLCAALGPPDRSHFRLTLAQAFNSLGTIVGAWFGSKIMLSGGLFAKQSASTDVVATRQHSLNSVDNAYFLMAGMLAVLLLFVWRMRHHFGSAKQSSAISIRGALSSRWALFGACAIFFYVGAEVTIASVMINFLHQPEILGVSMADAGWLLAVYYWGGAMVGRFAGSYLLTRVAAPRLLGSAAIMAGLLCLTVSQTAGLTAAVAALAIGLFNSIMFPVIFTVTLERSTASAESTSGLLCMAIVGGAVLPPLVGKIIDIGGLHAGYFVPAAAYAIIAGIAFAAAKTSVSGAVAASHAKPN
jgi:FHS family L-fucose permease-like MFS transporter